MSVRTWKTRGMWGLCPQPVVLPVLKRLNRIHQLIKLRFQREVMNAGANTIRTEDGAEVKALLFESLHDLTVT